MFYVVSEEFLSVHGAENSVQASIRWRSRREVVNWLTSMLSKQHRLSEYAMSPKDEPTCEVSAQQHHLIFTKGRLPSNLKDHQLEIKWSGTSWCCSKQLKHYPAFCRNGVKIAVLSFVLVMAEKDNHYVAYLEDMYEDRKCQKKVKVRWFHHNKEVRGVISLRNPHPKEVFITPYVQIISAECVDGPAIVLTHEHYDKCQAVFPHDLLRRMHFCNRQFKNNKVKPFKLTNLRGYFDQQIFSCFSPDFFEEEFSSEDDVKVGFKRIREHPKTACDLSNQRLKYDQLIKDPNFLKHVEGHFRHAPIFRLNEKVEFLCQDSGIRGCWFRCTVLEVSKRQMKILYNDVKDEDSHSNLEEWIPTYRVVKADKLGMRHPGRPTVRPVYPCYQRSLNFEVGDPVDAWWSDGWWEGVISDTSDCNRYQIYVPGENLYLSVNLKNLRISRDWVGGRWVDLEPNPNILEIVSASNKVSKSSAVSTEIKSDNSPTSCQKVAASHKLSAVLEEIHDLKGMTLTNVPLKDGYVNDEPRKVPEAEVEEIYSDHLLHDQGEEKDTVDHDLIDAEIKVNQENCLVANCDVDKDHSKTPDLEFEEET